MSFSARNLLVALTISCVILIVFVDCQKTPSSTVSAVQRQKRQGGPPGQNKKNQSARRPGGKKPQQPPGLVAKQKQNGPGGRPQQAPGQAAKQQKKPGRGKKPPQATASALAVNQTPPGGVPLQLTVQSGILPSRTGSGEWLRPPGSSGPQFPNSGWRPPYRPNTSSFSGAWTPPAPQQQSSFAQYLNNRYPPSSFHRPQPPQPPRPPYGGSKFSTYHPHGYTYDTQFRPYFHSQAHQFHHPHRPHQGHFHDFTEIFREIDSKDETNYNGTAEEDEINDDFNGRSIVAPGQYPHMAALGFESATEPVDFKCGGSLISDYFVLTAAHCCDLNGESPVIVKIGDIKLKEREQNVRPQRRRVVQVYIHPDYNESYYYNDIALLELDRPIEYTQYVRPIRLWAHNDIPYEKVYTMGYGSTSFAQAPTNILTELDMTIVATDKCNSTMPPEENAPNGIIDSQICAKDYVKNRDTCQGDSGGPLQLNLQRRNRRRLRYYLVGITSYGTFCRSPYPGVYTRVSWYVDWIASIVWPEHFQNFA